MDGSGSPNAYNSPFAIRRSLQVPEVQAAYHKRHPGLPPIGIDMAKTYLAYRDNSILSVIEGMNECDRVLSVTKREEGHGYATYYRTAFRNQCLEVKKADKLGLSSPDEQPRIVDSTLVEKPKQIAPPTKNDRPPLTNEEALLLSDNIPAFRTGSVVRTHWFG
jgi:hypothetical protein